MIYDIQLDYYGKRLVTCSSDRTFRVYDVSKAMVAGGDGDEHSAPKDVQESQQEQQLHVLQHVVPLADDSAAPIHRVAWAHPKFGAVVALAAQDGKVYIYREELVQQGAGGVGNVTEWRLKHVHEFHSLAVLSVAWAPYEYGLCLASASADGQVSFLTRMREGWVVSSSFRNSDEGMGCTSVSWAPYNSLGSQGAQGPIQRVVTGSCNHAVTIWQFVSAPQEGANAGNSYWEVVNTPLYGHNDWVRDVAWAPNVGIPANVIASASDDHTVRVWTQDEADGEWEAHVVHTFRAPVYRISWSLTGSVLSVAAGDDEVTFWKQQSNHEWTQMSSVTDQGAATIASH
ncbi:vesicle coat complex COPII subunit SEC13 [Phytophthora sojae]|uniref:Vesicle coat complex COPII subunit SEC13 n=1 Tax=Phytophthora sojae (strain P6497) TaxID=1094619 RepID=G4YMA2_PHYSP|nr:vesicle coat complex COPII subunit SEC13 [Phytophthora sojae]EGZ28232.1 vesicle coat complex COPII subunit SEC13 [Phytophthora sojae]|eukprot:XP_009515507.1 vesicle coat complex COPII subunit SEC13 [Phytophthora sojae]